MTGQPFLSSVDQLALNCKDVLCTDRCFKTNEEMAEEEDDE